MTKKEKILRRVGLTLVTLYFIYFSIYAMITTNYNKAYTIILIFVMIALLVVFFVKFNKQEEKSIFRFLETKKGEILTIAITLAVAILMRVLMFGVIPNGMMGDEYAMVYDSWCLANYGVDRYGNSWPVYLVSWGSGQTSLMAYLTIPFVALFGMNEYTTRIVSLIFSIISLFAFYFLMRRLASKKVAFISLLLFAFTPWQFMLSRWGLDCNLLPALLILGILFLVKSLQGNRWWFLLAGFFFGIALYSYAISWIFIPIFLATIYIYLIIKKRIHWPSFIAGNIILFCLALPLLMFVAVNYLGVPEFKIFGIFSVPKLSASREAVSNGINIFKNFANFLNLFLDQNDGLIWNCLIPFGVIFPILIPFLVLGVIHFIKAVNNKTITEMEMIIWIWAITGFAVAILLSSVSVNHINYLWPVALILSAYGVVDFCKNSKKCAISLACIFGVVVIMFNVCYFSKEHSDLSYKTYGGGTIEAIQFAEEIRTDEVIKTNVSYMKVLVATETNPYDFSSTIVWVNPNGGIRSPISFTHYLFVWDEDDDQDSIYVLSNSTEFNEDGEWEHKTFGYYTVYYKLS